MKIDFQHLGGIDKGCIELNDFTIFCGKNNSGKTYAMYSLYGLLEKDFDIRFDFVKKINNKLKQEGTWKVDVREILSLHKDEMVKHIQDHFKKYLPRLFGVTDEDFANTEVLLNLDDENLQQQAIKKSAKNALSLGKVKDWTLLLEKEPDSEIIHLTLHNIDIPDRILEDFISKAFVSILFACLSKDSFLLPAERAGLNLFFKELSSTRNLLLQHAQKDKVDPMELLKDIISSRYADPINDYIQYLHKIGQDRNVKGHFRVYAQDMQKKVLNGKYQVDSQGNVYFLPYRSNQSKLHLHFSSSTVKTLFGLVFYLEHLAKDGDCLMIDEPELNLHPDNQRQVARILAQLVNAGLKVVVSTHSDYFVRELNNLIMLQKRFTGSLELQKKYGYQDNELISANRVSAYLFDDKKITKMKMDDDEGIIAQTFDDVINQLNDSSNEIYFAMQEAKESDS